MADLSQLQTPRPAKRVAGQKTASGIFLNRPPTRARKIDAQVTNLRRVKKSAATKSASGVRNHRNRYYSPSLGRWTATDPIRFKGGLNLYGYTGNAPVMTTDSMGLSYLDDECDPRYMPCQPGDVWRDDIQAYGAPIIPYTPPAKRDCLSEAGACAARGLLFCSLVEQHPEAKLCGPAAYRACMADAKPKTSGLDS
jgi:RHS repeat-associated protein